MVKNVVEQVHIFGVKMRGYMCQIQNFVLNGNHWNAILCRNVFDIWIGGGLW